MFLRWHLGWLATLMVLFFIAIHHLLMLPNAPHPPKLRAPFFFMLGSLLAETTVWVIPLWRRFRRPW